MTEATLARRISVLRGDLARRVQAPGDLGHPDVVEASRRLDRLIVRYLELTRNERGTRPR